MNVLIDSGNTHNFIHQKVVETHCYIHAIHDFEIMIANGGMMICDHKCENVILQMGYYQLKSHIFTIEIGGYDVS